MRLLWILVWMVLAAPVEAQETVLDRSRAEMTEVQLWEEYRGWRDAEEIERANQVAAELVERTLQVHGQKSVEYGLALSEQGITALLLERNGEALRDLSRAESLLREQLPLYSEKLIAPLTFLGSALQATGRHPEALDAFSRAQHITHRLWGANNDTQIRIVYAKADSIQAMGDFFEAEQMHQLAYKLHRVNYGADSPEAIQASAWLGTWLRSTGDYYGSIAHFHQALTELQGDGPDRPEAFPLLWGMAHAYRGGYRGKYARSMHQRILALMDSEPDAFTLNQRIEAHLEYGDWLMQRYYEKKSVKQYEAAWRLAHAAGPAGQVWLERFSAPELIRYGEMVPSDVGGHNQFVEFEFDLTADGRPRKVQVTDHGTDGRVQYEARQLFPKLMRFRPPIVEGRAVARPDQTVTMYILPQDYRIEPDPIAAPARLANQPAADVSLKVGQETPASGATPDKRGAGKAG